MGLLGGMVMMQDVLMLWRREWWRNFWSDADLATWPARLQSDWCLDNHDDDGDDDDDDDDDGDGGDDGR